VPFSLILSLPLLPLLAGCSRSVAPSQALLPTQVAIVAEQEAGSPGEQPEAVSVVLDLRRNSRDQLDVRVSNGVRLWDGRHMWKVTEVQDALGHGLHVQDQQAKLGGDIPLHAADRLRVVGMTRRDVWVELPDLSVFRCALARPSCEAAPVEALPLNHPGPGGGFELTLRDGALRLTLPFAEGEPAVLLDHVTRLIGVHWVHEGWLQQDPMLDQTYRGRAQIVAQARDVTVDGDLDDWSDAEPLVVDAPWQVEAGAERWDGAGDASFSVAAARQTHSGASRGGASGDACFAGRVRDDAWTAEDVVVLRIGDAEVSVAPQTDGVFSRTFEVCTTVNAGDLPFVAAYIDHDPDGSTTLSSAPLNGGKTEGRVRVP
jgi:hypothetical protein